jgi:hypothetical protein
LPPAVETWMMPPTWRVQPVLRGEALDWGYVEEWCRAWGVEERLGGLRSEIAT